MNSSDGSFFKKQGDAVVYNISGSVGSPSDFFLLALNFFMKICFCVFLGAICVIVFVVVVVFGGGGGGECKELINSMKPGSTSRSFMSAFATLCPIFLSPQVAEAHQQQQRIPFSVIMDLPMLGTIHYRELRVLVINRQSLTQEYVFRLLLVGDDGLMQTTQ